MLRTHPPIPQGPQSLFLVRWAYVTAGRRYLQITGPDNVRRVIALHIATTTLYSVRSTVAGSGRKGSWAGGASSMLCHGTSRSSLPCRRRSLLLLLL